MAHPDLDELSRSASDALHVGVGLIVLALQHTADQRRAAATHLRAAQGRLEGAIADVRPVVPPEARDVLGRLGAHLAAAVAPRTGTR